MKKLGLFLLLSSIVTLPGCATFSTSDSASAEPGQHNTVPGRQYRMKDGKVYTQGGWKHELNFPKHMDTKGEKTIVFDPNIGGWAAYDASGDLIRYGIASGGANFCKDVGRPCRTAQGTFKVYRKGGKHCKSSKYPLHNPKTGKQGGAPMAYCMFFKGGIAMHASDFIPDWNASHGCVRLPYADAKWLNQDFAHLGTRVVVKEYLE